MSSSRAAAAPCRTAGIVRGDVPLPAVMPSSGTRSVSAMMSWMRYAGTRSSSAAAWVISAREPCPASTLPVMTVMIPSLPMCSRAARFLAPPPANPPPPRPPRPPPPPPRPPPATWPSTAVPPMPPATAMSRPAPRTFTASRRVIPKSNGTRSTGMSSSPCTSVCDCCCVVVFVAMALPPRLRRAAHGLFDPHVAAAAAQVLVHPGRDLGLARAGVLLQQPDGRHDHARRAVAALERPLFEERRLNRVQLVALGEAFDRPHRLAVGVRDRRAAGERALAVDEDGAGAAPALAAAVLGAGELQVLAQHVQERPLGIGRHRPPLAVHGQVEG